MYKVVFYLNNCRLTKKVLKSTGAKVLFIATDRHPMIEEFTEHLKDLEVTLTSTSNYTVIKYPIPNLL